MTTLCHTSAPRATSAGGNDLSGMRRAGSRVPLRTASSSSPAGRLACTYADATFSGSRPPAAKLHVQESTPRTWVEYRVNARTPFPISPAQSPVFFFFSFWRTTLMHKCGCPLLPWCHPQLSCHTYTHTHTPSAAASPTPQPYLWQLNNSLSL